MVMFLFSYQALVVPQGQKTPSRHANTLLGLIIGSGSNPKSFFLLLIYRGLIKGYKFVRLIQSKLTSGCRHIALDSCCAFTCIGVSHCKVFSKLFV